MLRFTARGPRGDSRFAGESWCEARLPACQHGMLVLDRGQFGLQEVVQLRENPTEAPGGTAGPTGRIATCALFACNSCGFVRTHSLAAIGQDNML
jgi:hypothetical protein